MRQAGEGGESGRAVAVDLEELVGGEGVGGGGAETAEVVVADVGHRGARPVPQLVEDGQADGASLWVGVRGAGCEGWV